MNEQEIQVGGLKITFNEDEEVVVRRFARGFDSFMQWLSGLPIEDAEAFVATLPKKERA